MEEKRLVQAGYDAIAETYTSWAEDRFDARQETLDKLFDKLSPTSRVLELGCGAGVPITRILTERVAEVVGNDISSRQLELAKVNCPKATFVLGDMTALDLPHGTFDAVLGFFTIFHLPRDEHPAMYARVREWLRAGGFFLFNLAVGDHASIRQNFFGVDMFWSSHDVQKSLDVIAGAGFEVIDHEVREEVTVKDEDDPDNGTKFLWIIARKIEKVKESIDRTD